MGTRRFPDAEICREFLQFAVFVADAGEALRGVVGQKQFHDCFSDADDAGVMGNYIHAFPYIVAACGFNAPVTFRYADAADGAFAQIRVIAEDGNIGAGFSGGFQNPRAFRHGYRYSVYG
jgi:hypothetical protein